MLFNSPHFKCHFSPEPLPPLFKCTYTFNNFYASLKQNEKKNLRITNTLMKKSNITSMLHDTLMAPLSHFPFYTNNNSNIIKCFCVLFSVYVTFLPLNKIPKTVSVRSGLFDS